MAQNPFATKAAPAAPAAPTAAAAVVPVPVTNTGTAKAAKVRKSPNRRKTDEEIKFILQNYKDMETSTIAHKLGLTRQQVYRTINDTRKRIETKIEAATTPAEKEKLQAFLTANLPNKPFGGGSSGPRRNAIDDVIGDLIG